MRAVVASSHADWFRPRGCPCLSDRPGPAGPGNETPGAFGFSPRPEPKLISTYKTHGPALSISKGLDRDRAVDETGHQVAVFGRRGARPFNLQEMQRMFLRNGQVWSVSDTPAAGDQVTGASGRLPPSSAPAADSGAAALPQPERRPQAISETIRRRRGIPYRRRVRPR